mgnify:FL=1
MYRVRPLIEKSHLKPIRYIKKNSVYIIETRDSKYVIKKKNDNSILEYLKSRNFDYMPKVIDEDETYQLTEYIEGISVPEDQKIFDLIDVVSLLHYKTTHFKEADANYYKGLYEDVVGNIEYLKGYYDDLISIIDGREFMAPYEYVIARNIGKIYGALEFCKSEIDVWYDEVKDEKKRRVVVLHNNLDLSHFIRNEESYLISWNKSKIDNPIFDLYKLYKRHGNEFDFASLLNRYENKYPLFNHEKRFLFVLMSLPDEINFDDSTYNITTSVSERIDLIYKTENIISPYYSEEGKDK